MYFGQKIYTRDGVTTHGKWRPYETRAHALADGCHFVSILEIVCTVAEYRHWCQTKREGHNPDRCRLHFPFRGPFYADFDRAHDVPGLQRDLAAALQRLIDVHALKPEDFQLWYSGGKGFHLEIPAVVCGAETLAHRHLPTIYKRLAALLGFGELMDAAVYTESRGRLWRVEGQPRSNGQRKIPLTLEDLQTQPIDSIQHRAQFPILPNPAPKPTLRLNPALTTLFQKALKEAETQKRQTQKNTATGVTRGNPPNPTNKLPQAERQRIEEALARLSPAIVDDYQAWLTIGMALHQGTAGSEEGFELWDRWSRQSPKYNPEATATKWPTFHSEDEEDTITLATLFYLAEER